MRGEAGRAGLLGEPERAYGVGNRVVPARDEDQVQCAVLADGSDQLLPGLIAQVVGRVQLVDGMEHRNVCGVAPAWVARLAAREGGDLGLVQICSCCEDGYVNAPLVARAAQCRRP